MSRFRKLSQTIWHCQYHIMWTPKNRYRILTDQLGLDVDSCIRAFSDQLKCEITELNVQIDSCTPFGHGTAEDINFRLCWYRKRTNSDKSFK